MATGGEAVWEGTPFRVHRGPIGSGDAVITDEHADIRQWLHTVHEKVLAVETEAAEVVQAFHEVLDRDTARSMHYVTMLLA